MKFALKYSGSGGSKAVYSMGNGLAVARGLKSDHWQTTVKREVAASIQLRNLGLNAPQLMVIYPKNGAPLLLMHSFEFLARQGMQIIDSKNPQSSVTNTPVFKAAHDIENPQYLKNLLQNIMPDITTLISNRIGLSADSINLCIEDKADSTATKEVSQNYDLRLFLFDLEDKWVCAELIDSTGHIKTDLITAEADRYLQMSFDTIKNHLQKTELSKILPELNYNHVELIDSLEKNFKEVKTELITALVTQVTTRLNASSNVPLPICSHPTLQNTIRQAGIPPHVWSNFPAVVQEMTVDVTPAGWQAIPLTDTDNNENDLNKTLAELISDAVNQFKMVVTLAILTIFHQMIKQMQEIKMPGLAATIMSGYRESMFAAPALATASPASSQLTATPPTLAQ